jgi:MATE family multidrug resistance protein
VKAPVRPRRRRELRAWLHEGRELLHLAGPLIVSHLGQVGMSTADTIMVGPLGATPLAAAGLGTAIHFLGLIACVGVLVGMTPLVSQAYGAGDLAQCRRVLVQGLWLATLLSVPVAWMNFVGGEIALLLGQDAAVSELTGGYMSALAWGLLPHFLFTAFRHFLEAMGRVRAPMIITFVGLGVNIVANRLFIYGVDGWIPAMGVVGTGWATTTVRWTMLGAMLVYLYMQSDVRVFDRGKRAVDAALLGRIARVGAPVGAHFALEVGLFSFAAVMMGWLGPVQLAAHQVTINIASTTFMVALGASLAGSIRVGQRIGQHRARAMRRAALSTYVVAVGFMACCAIAFVAAPRTLIRIYTPDEAIIALGAKLLLLAGAFQVFDGAQVAGGAVLRGAADTRSAMLIAAVGYWGVGTPCAYLLAFTAGLGPMGIWAGLTAGLAVAAVLLALRARARLWKGDFARLRVGGV